MSAADKPVVALTVEKPITLADVVKWADLAASLSFPTDAPVEVGFHPMRLTARAFLSTTSSRQRDPETGRFTSVKAAS